MKELFWSHQAFGGKVRALEDEIWRVMPKFGTVTELGEWQVLGSTIPPQFMGWDPRGLNFTPINAHWRHLKQNQQICQEVIKTRSSADADNRLDAFSGQSRSTNMVPFHM